MSAEQNMLIHLAAGGLAGTIGSVLTCPLEVVKTRFQASSTNFERVHHLLNEKKNSMKLSSHLNNKPQSAYSSLNVNLNNLIRNTHLAHHHKNVVTNGLTFEAPLNNNHLQYSITKASSANNRIGSGIYLHLRFIVEHEGYRALFKGLLPNIVGVAPYRAIYFFSYANAKKYLLNVFGEEKTLLHICSAYCAGFTAVSITNPIWFVKTRLQLDESKRGLTTKDVVKKIFKNNGILGFYKGISASYFGISETALYFVIYEKLKSMNRESMSGSPNENLTFLTIFFSAGFSKTLASCLCYPHEVARTRLRQEGSKYNGFFQTLALVAREEGVRGLYKGMATHLIRQIPNTAIVMTSYELLIRYFE